MKAYPVYSKFVVFDKRKNFQYLLKGKENKKILINFTNMDITLKRFKKIMKLKELKVNILHYL